MQGIFVSYLASDYLWHDMQMRRSMNIKNGVRLEVAVCTDWVTHSPAGAYATPAQLLRSR